MARIRSIKPEVCTSFTMCILSDAAERAFTRLWTHADDEGRGIDNPKLIKAAIFPLNDEKTEAVISAILDELEDAGFLIRYEVDGRRFFEIPNFGVHQKPRHPVPSKFPPPNGRSSTAGRRSSAAVGGSPPAVVVVGDGGGDGVGRAPQGRRSGPTSFEVTGELRAWAAEHFPRVDVERETSRFLDHHRAVGSKLADWGAAWRKWIDKADSFLPPVPVEATARVIRLHCDACNGVGVIELADGTAVDCDCKTERRAL